MTALPGCFLSTRKAAFLWHSSSIHRPIGLPLPQVGLPPHVAPGPGWGPVPDGWQLWVEEPDPEPIDVDETPLEPLISEESAEALGASEPVQRFP